MSVLIASTTNAAQSSGTDIDAGSSVMVIATSGIQGESCLIEASTSTDTWSQTGEAITLSKSAVIITGPVTFRINKPVSVVPFAIEILE